MTWKHIEEFVNNPTITLEHQQYTQLPEEISEASKNYYMYGANPSSNNMIYDPSATTPARFKQTSNEKYKAIYQSVHSSINELGLNETYLSNMNDLFEKTQEENIKLKKNTENYLKRTATDDRKTEYKNKSYVGLMPYTYILLFIYFSLLAYYILFSNFLKDKLYLSDKIGFFIFIYVLLPYLISVLLSYFI
uniref:Uncharacterized protein n=1 Tax=viral metagenome TaxID=1070528 RepID=A0A6C0HPQ7_9ZZZZ